MAAEGIRARRTIPLPSSARARIAHRRHPSAGPPGRHAYGEFAIFFTWLIIRRQNDRLALPYDLGAYSMIPKHGIRFSEKLMLKDTP
jgi:hypothetical protein